MGCGGGREGVHEGEVAIIMVGKCYQTKIWTMYQRIFSINLFFSLPTWKFLFV